MVNTSWMNEIKYPDEACTHCGAKGWGIGHYVDAGGQPKYPFFCLNCGKRIPGFAKRKAVERSGIEVKELFPQIPLFFCEVCKKEGAEQHHWAPTHLFGDEAERWPKSFRCRECDDKWHKIVTPNMSNNA